MNWVDCFTFSSLGFLLIGAYFVLRATEAQGRAGRARLRQDPNPNVARTADVWRPGPNWWIHTRKHRAEWADLERQIKDDPDPTVHERFVALVRELNMWNDIETGVSLAVVGSLWALIAAVVNVIARG